MDYRDNRQRWAESHQVVHFYAGQWCTFTLALTVHAISDAHCRPLAFYLTPGQTADIKGAVMLADHLPAARYLLADKAYDADHWRAWLKRRRIRAVIPNK